MRKKINFNQINYRLPTWTQNELTKVIIKGNVSGSIQMISWVQQAWLLETFLVDTFIKDM